MVYHRDLTPMNASPGESFTTSSHAELVTPKESHFHTFS